MALVSALTPDEMVQVAKGKELETLPQLELAIPKLLITDAERKHKRGILDLLRDLDQDYPQFLSDWLPKKLDDPSLRKKIIAIGEKVAAISISGDKGDHVVKLSTFFTNPYFRELGLGQHLLYHEIINWANRGVRKVLVTFPSGKKEMIPFIRRCGFWIEGVSPLRYGKRAELVMGRYFLYEIVRNEDWPRFVENLISDIFVCNQLGEAEVAMRLPSVKGSDFVCPLREMPLPIEDRLTADGANLTVLDYA